MAVPVSAQEPSFALPIDCTLNDDCHIQQFPDVDPGPGALDFACGPLSYDGHSGTDFALPSTSAMRSGVDVLAPADGVVLGWRDDMADVDQRDIDAPDVTDRECGNGVLLDHGQGWETQLCHLKRGTVQVVEGQEVKRGDIVGQVGFSGATEFPHVHMSVRHNGQTVDPFQPDQVDGCIGTASKTLWDVTPSYRPGGMIAVGFAPSIPDYSAIRDGAAAAEELNPGEDFVIWAFAFGGRQGDILVFDVMHNEKILLSEEVTLDKEQAQFYRAVGRRAPAAGWPPGQYQGTVQHLRSGATIDTRRLDITVTP